MFLLKALKSLEKINRPFWILAGILTLLGVGILDYVTGVEISFSLFYVLPIAMITWFLNYRLGIAAAIFSAGVWVGVDILSGNTYSSQAIYFWNTAIRLGFFLITVFALEMGKNLEREKNFSRIDYVTNAVNGRFFHALMERELDRFARNHSPFTIAYMDVDNFKTINDQFGHTIGDKVLCYVVDTLQKHLRKTDIVARMGGDEFAIFLPEVGTDPAREVISKMYSRLMEMFQENNWPVTFSMGVVTFINPPASVEEVIRIVDRAMYSVKNSGKNDILYLTQD